jgi:hypothetical protein
MSGSEGTRGFFAFERTWLCVFARKQGLIGIVKLDFGAAAVVHVGEHHAESRSSCRRWTLQVVGGVSRLLSNVRKGMETFIKGGGKHG